MPNSFANMQALDWDDLKFILAVSRSRSLAAASRVLAVNESTVARRIKRAEQKLDAQLFERSSGLLIPTSVGEVVIAGSERIELETQNIEHQVKGSDTVVAGSVRLTSVPIVLHHILAPALHSLYEKHPQLQIELISEPRDLSLTRREADIAIRLARPTDELRAITRKVGKLDYAVYGSAGYLQEDVPWLQFDETMLNIPQARWIANQLEQGKLSSTSVNDSETLLVCLKAGLGKSLLPTVIGDCEPSLVRLDASIVVSREMWIMTHPDLQKLGRIRAVIDWLVGTLDNL